MAMVPSVHRVSAPSTSESAGTFSHAVKSAIVRLFDLSEWAQVPYNEYRAVHAAKIAAGLVASAATGSAMISLWRMLSLQRKLRNAKTNDRPPGPKPLPFLGNMLDLRAAYYETLYEYVEQPASVFWVMSVPFVIINEEVGLRRVLGGANGLYTKPKYFGYRSRTLSSAVDAQRDRVADESIAYDADGDASRVALEQMVREAFPKIKQRMHGLLRGMEAKKSDEDAVHAVRCAIVALNLDVLFGARVGEGGENARHISDMIDFAGTEFARRMVNPLKVFVDLRGNFRFMRDVTALIALGRRLGRSLDDAATVAASPAAGVSWVHAWVGKVGRVGKLGKVVGLLMASTQTVPLTAVWMLHIVSNEDHVRAKIQAELSAHNIHSIVDLDYDRLEGLVYIDAVIKEVLRLYPPFPLIQRQAQRDDVLGGVTVPSGTIVYVVPWLVHRNGRFWHNAHQFIPERFVDGSASHGDAPSDWVYVPFGRGARMCAGSKLASAELKVLLIHTILGFKCSSQKLKPRSDERFPELGMAPRGIRMRMASDDKTKALDSIFLKEVENEEAIAKR